MRRTAVVTLAVSDKQRDALHRTAEHHLYCANRTADYCWSDILSQAVKVDATGVAPVEEADTH